MFAFGAQYKGGFTFVQTSSGHVYTYPSKAEALVYFACVKSRAHLYEVDTDLSEARLIGRGNNTLPAPDVVELTEDHKMALYESFPYKSLLAWKPIPSFDV